jgi:hypothetical protein
MPLAAAGWRSESTAALPLSSLILDVGMEHVNDFETQGVMSLASEG